MATTTIPEQHVAALADAIAVAGSQSALGRVLGVSQRAVWRWVNKRKPLPAQHVLKVEAATGIPKERLRPDLYPDERTPADAALDRRPAAPRASSAYDEAAR